MLRQKCGEQAGESTESENVHLSLVLQLQPRKRLNKRKSACASRFEVAGVATRVNELAHDAELLFTAIDTAVSRPTAGARLGARLFFTLACIVNISETYARTFTRIV